MQKSKLLCTEASPEARVAARARGRLARLSSWLLLPLFGLIAASAAPGDLDFSFVPAPVTTGPILSLAVMNGTNVLIGGWISTTNSFGGPLAGLVRLSSDGSLDNSFAIPAVATAVTAMALTPGNQIVCVGIQTNGLNGAIRRLNSDGTLDPTLDLTVTSPLSPWLYAVAVQPDGKILAAGSFTAVAGQPRTNLVRLLTNGIVDFSFKTNFTSAGAIEALVLQPDGRILIGGSFTNINGVVRAGIARLNVDGTLDTSFNPSTGVDGSVKAIALQADSTVLIGGHFFSVNKIGRQCLARLLPNGSVDTSFDPGSGAAAPSFPVSSDWPVVESIAIQGDGRLLVAGKFASFAGIARPGIVRLHWDASVDLSFDPGVGPDAPVSALAIQADGNLVIGGEFAQVSGVARSHVARLFSNGTFAVAPIITQQPADLAAVIGRAATFTVAATGTPALLYQWLKAGYVLAGQTNSTLTISNSQDADAGGYSVKVSNPGGSSTSVTANLTVGPVPVAPAIVTQPQNQLIELGTAALFSASASGSVPQFWKWRLAGKDVAGATNATLSFASVTTNLAGLYSAVVTNAAGTATSQNASLIVFVPPLSQTSPSTSNVTFRVQSFGSGSLSYQWRLAGTNIPGATSASLVLTNVDLNDAGSYSVALATPTAVATSSPALLSVQMPPLIVTQPTNQTITLGAAGLLQVVAAGSDVLSYQWRMNGTNLPSATNSSLVFAAIQATDAGYYSAVASNPFGSVTSQVAAVTVAGGATSLFRLESTSGSLGGTVVVPLNLIGLGDENTIACSVGFDPAILSLQSISNGAAIVAGVSVVLNTNDASKGKMGVLIARAAGDTFGAGTNSLLNFQFKVTTSLTGSTTTLVAFVTSPLAPELVSIAVKPLAASYVDAAVTLDAGLEGDVAGEPNGNGQLTAADWTLVGRLVAGLSKPVNAGEFARADCAPAETKGDGALTAADWTQAGRYVVGLDSPQAAGGPAASSLQSNPSPQGAVGLQDAPDVSTSLRVTDRSLMSLQSRSIALSGGAVKTGNTLELAVRLTAAGDENTAAFTVRFDPSRLAFRAARPGASLTGGSTLMLNTNRVAQGRLGVLLGQPAGKAFAAGNQELLRVELVALGGPDQTMQTQVSFDDQPVVREVVSALVRILPTTYQPGSVQIEMSAVPPGPVQISRDDQNGFVIRWALAVPGVYSVEVSTNLIDWSVVTTGSLSQPGYVEFNDPVSANWHERFYRLRYENSHLAKVIEPGVHAAGSERSRHESEAAAKILHAAMNSSHWPG